MRRSSVPWGLIIVLALGAFVLWSIFRARAQPGVRTELWPGNAAARAIPACSPGMAMGLAIRRRAASGLMGNLASGLAIGAGVAAGEELVRHVIGGNSANAAPLSGADLRDPPQNQDMGGADFGTQDGSSWGNDSSGGDSGGWGGDSGGGGDWS